MAEIITADLARWREACKKADDYPMHFCGMAFDAVPRLLDALEAVTAERNRLKRHLDVEAGKIVEPLIAENERLRVDSENYRGKCGVCSTACMDMLTDSVCVACERDRLAARVSSLEQALQGCITALDDAATYHRHCEKRTLLAAYKAEHAGLAEPLEVAAVKARDVLEGKP